MVKRHLNKILPIGSKRRAVAKRLLGRGSPQPQPTAPTSVDYDTWVEKLEPQLFKDTVKQLASATYRPLISVIVPCYNTPAKYIVPLIDSVLAQKYDHWQLVLADGSTDTAASERLRGLAQKDGRITYVPIKENLGIVGNTNIGLEHAKGTFVGFLDHDDVLSKYALAEVVLALQNDEKLDLIYSDEDKLADDGSRRLLPFFKPDWSPEMLLGVNYITHFVVARKKLVDELDGLRSGFDGAQDYDFLLRLTEVTDRIHHIPKMLYHWRLADGSTATTVDQKNYADTAGQRALKDAVKRRGIDAEVVEIPERPTNYRLRYKLPSPAPKVSIIIPFKDKADLLKQCAGSILAKSIYQNYELILVSNNSTEPELFAYLDELKKDSRCKVFIWDHPFNYSAVNNYGRRQATGEYLIFLNNDTEVMTPAWIEELVGVAAQPDIGEVGALLHYPDTTIQHAGIILGLGTMAGLIFSGRQPTDWSDFGLACWPRNYLAVTGACVAIEAKKYDQIGGLDEKFIIAGNDVALGISLYEAGYRNVFWPFAELIHYENRSVGAYSKTPSAQNDYDLSLKYYRPYLNWHDPYFNPNLDLMNEQVGIRGNYE